MRELWVRKSKILRNREELWVGRKKNEKLKLWSGIAMPAGEQEKIFSLDSLLGR